MRSATASSTNVTGEISRASESPTRHCFLDAAIYIHFEFALEFNLRLPCFDFVFGDGGLCHLQYGLSDLTRFLHGGIVAPREIGPVIRWCLFAASVPINGIL